MATIVLNPFGSFGDLHPYLALALELQRRRHQPLIATSAIYREKIEAEGLAFRAVRPDVSRFLDSPQLAAKLWDSHNGTTYLLRDFLIPEVRGAYEDLHPVCDGADLLVTHMAAYAGPVVADRLQMPWVSVALQPAGFFSAHDMMVLPQAPWLRHLYGLNPWLARLLLRIGERETTKWAEPIWKLRHELGLALGNNPVMRGQLSPHGTVALFSRHYAPPQPDWPGNTSQPGFVFYDHPGPDSATHEMEARLNRKLQTFLQSGEPPILFTLGSSAVLQAGQFFEESSRAAQELGRRAILLIGRQAKPMPTSRDVFVAPYLRFSEVMPHVAAVVHQGGIGTTAQTLRAGKPALVVPWAHDQPDNGYRLARLGVARVLERRRYRALPAAQQLEKLLRDAGAQTRAGKFVDLLRSEPSIGAACDAIESALR